MANFINIALIVFYVAMGFIMIYMAYKALVTIPNSKKYGTALFWLLIAIPFIFGTYIPAWVIGLMLVIASLLTLTKQVTLANYKALNEEHGEKQALKLKNKIFIPSLVLAAVAVLVSMIWATVPNSSVFAIGVAAIVAFVFAIAVTHGNPVGAIEDGARLFDAMGPSAILPQVLVALGALFTVAGVGNVIAKSIGGFIPSGNHLLGVIAYVLGMVIFTMIMGNAFAAFAVITAGIGVPFVLSQGANPAFIGALALTAGYCGTLLTPMAANFNIIPPALLEMKDKNGVIKAQAPVALVLIVAHIIAMYFIAF